MRVAVVGERRRFAGMTAVSVWPSVSVVDRADPFHWTVEGVLFATKPLPVRVIVRSPLPITTDVGLKAVSVGVGLVTGRLTGSEVAVAGAGLLTVMLRVAALTQ